MKIVHIIHNDKFINPFIDFIEKNFNKDEHLFIFLDGSDEKVFSIPKVDNVLNINNLYGGKKNILKLSHILNPILENADKIILHSLFSGNLIFYLYLHQKYLKKCYWVLWGGDLYADFSRKKTLKSRFSLYIKSKVINKIGGIITYIKEGDFILAQKWHKTQAVCYESFFYPSNLYEEYHIKSKKHTTVNILVGNSADPTNNHIEVFEKLKKYKDEDIKIIAPLSYGNQENAKKLIEMGKQIFGDKFKPLIEFMPFEKYLELLGEIDIAIFNHNRQQAMGNITTLLGLGKKVYVRNDQTPWKMFNKLQIKVFDTTLDISIDHLDKSIQAENEKKVKAYFSEDNLVKQWGNILDN